MGDGGPENEQRNCEVRKDENICFEGRELRGFPKRKCRGDDWLVHGSGRSVKTKGRVPSRSAHRVQMQMGLFIVNCQP
jgi:hypothetical protein